METQLAPYKETEQWFGGSSGTKFESSYSKTARLRVIRLYPGKYLFYSVLGGIFLDYGFPGFQHSFGSCTGTPTELVLAEDEAIIFMEGRSGAYIDFLSFTTNKGRNVSQGGSGGKNKFSYSSPPYTLINGFYGAAGAVIDSIGPILLAPPAFVAQKEHENNQKALLATEQKRLQVEQARLAQERMREQQDRMRQQQDRMRQEQEAMRMGHTAHVHIAHPTVSMPLQHAMSMPLHHAMPVPVHHSPSVHVHHSPSVHVNPTGAAASQHNFNWKHIPGVLSRVSVGGNNVWGVNPSQEIFKFNGNSWDRVNGVASWISAASDGTVWCVNKSDEVFQWAGTNWVKMPGALRVISVGSRNNVWGANSAGNIFYWSGHAWQAVDGGAVQVSVGEDGWVWCINSRQEIFRRQGAHGKWEPVSGKLVNVSCCNRDTVAGVNSSNEIFLWKNNQWVKANGQLTNISVGGSGYSRVWGVNSLGQVHKTL